MADYRRKNQEWILDRFVRSLGLDALMPDMMALMRSPVMGYDGNELDTVVARTRGALSMQREYEAAGTRRLNAARDAEAAGSRATARRRYHQAALFFGMAQYFRQVDGSPVKQRLHAQSQDCYRKVIGLADTPIEKVEIPFIDEPAYDSETFPGLLHLPGPGGRWPCVIFVPGTDMYKEQLPNPEDNIFAKRGLACLTLDGPGQGESLLRMLKVRVQDWNYERAVSAAIDYLVSRDDIDPDRIAVMGVSTGSYWAPRACIWEARHGKRLRACAGMSANWEPGHVTEFEYAQPNFKSNYLYMAGEEEDEFDSQVSLNTLDRLIGEVECPILMVMGDFDELCSPDQVRTIMKQVRVPAELWLYENQFHPLGGVAMDAWETTLDWLVARLDGEPMEQGVRERTFARR